MVIVIAHILHAGRTVALAFDYGVFERDEAFIAQPLGGRLR